MKNLITFIEKHKSFFKRLIIFVLCYIVIAVINNPTITALFEKMFGEYINTAIHALIPTFLLTTEV